jgi:hypothetical protein
LEYEGSQALPASPSGKVVVISTLPWREVFAQAQTSARTAQNTQFSVAVTVLCLVAVVAYNVKISVL